MKFDFSLPSHSGEVFHLRSIFNTPQQDIRLLVLFFYPKDDTPGCTIESQNFKAYYQEFLALGCQVVGISRDSIKSHCKFAEKNKLPYQLLSDENEEVCNLFNVIKTKTMYGKEVRGIERSTFLIDSNGEIIKEWRKVTPADHAEKVLEFIKNYLITI